MAAKKKQKTPGGKKSGKSKKQLDLSDKSPQSPPESQLHADLDSEDPDLAKSLRNSLLDSYALQPAFPALTQVGIC